MVCRPPVCEICEKAEETSDRMLLHFLMTKRNYLRLCYPTFFPKAYYMLHNTEMEKHSFQTLVPHLYNMMRDPEVRPYIKLWLN
ncbi:hypothetical protein, partial [Priestia megaterium]|uniref:hypothetical protein n=1 Tax=Priestia megaterium TaxID=1404 RepID=UPI002877C9B8